MGSGSGTGGWSLSLESSSSFIFGYLIEGSKQAVVTEELAVRVVSPFLLFSFHV